MMNRQGTASLLITSILFLVSNSTLAQTFPSSLQVIPVGPSISGHRWSHQQSIEFDIVHLKQSDGNGVHMYFGVSPKSNIIFTDHIEAVALTKPIKLFKECKKKLCRYTTLINTGLQSYKKDTWVQIWISSHEKDIDRYLDWLAALKFAKNAN